MQNMNNLILIHQTARDEEDIEKKLMQEIIAGLKRLNAQDQSRPELRLIV
jgi:hypothetical protein